MGSTGMRPSTHLPICQLAQLAPSPLVSVAVAVAVTFAVAAAVAVSVAVSVSLQTLSSPHFIPHPPCRRARAPCVCWLASLGARPFHSVSAAYLGRARLLTD